ncbi:MAG: hypothetical protein ACI37Z_03420 [Candidatus Gastranaerophilaceae bacterium]
MENKKNKSVINVFLIIGISIVSVLIIILSISLTSNISLLQKSGENVNIGENNAVAEATIAPENLFREYQVENYTLSLSEDGVYQLKETSVPYTFSGGYIYKHGEEILDLYTKKDLLQIGINPKKINMENLYAIKADYGEHTIPGGTEYYNSNIHEANDNSFYFFIYFKSSEDKTFVGVNAPEKIKNINFERSFF